MFHSNIADFCRSLHLPLRVVNSCLFPWKKNAHELWEFYLRRNKSLINTVEQKDELNFGLGGADQVNRAQSTVQRIKDTVSLLVRRSDMLPYWDGSPIFVMFVTQKNTG